MPNPSLSTLPLLLLSGFLAGALFLLILGAGLGFLFMFIPTLPLFYVGLGHQPKLALEAGILASLLVLTVTNMAAGLLFFAFLALPVWMMSRFALRWHAHEFGAIWYPMGWIMLRLSIYASCALAAITLCYMAVPGGLPHLLSQLIHDEFAGLQGELGDMVDLMANQWAFLVFPVTIWMWALALYGHGWLVNWQLNRHHRALRPDFNVTLFPLPQWLLQLLGLCAIASLLGSESVRFLGNGLLVVLMLPYFFLGTALINIKSRHWANRPFFLGMIYFLMLTLLWPALIFSAIGLWHHVKSLNKHLSSGGSSFKR